MKKADVAIISFFLVLAVIAFGYAKLYLNQSYDKEYAVIYVNNALYKKIFIPDKNYKENINIKNEIGENTISIRDGGAVMVDADCHDKVCVKSGFIDKPGQTIVCLPHKLVVEIEGQKNVVNKKDADEISY